MSSPFVWCWAKLYENANNKLSPSDREEALPGGKGGGVSDTAPYSFSHAHLNAHYNKISWQSLQKDDRIIELPLLYK